jgi:hypothetical protein
MDTDVRPFLSKVAAASILAGFMWQASIAQDAPSAAGRIENGVAVFSGLDKITGRIVTFDVNLNETVQFGALQVTPRICYTRLKTETPETIGFIEVQEITLDKKIRTLFNGWVFEASPGLSAVEHPIYDVWLVNCKNPR